MHILYVIVYTPPPSLIMIEDIKRDVSLLLAFFLFSSKICKVPDSLVQIVDETLYDYLRDSDDST